MENRDSMRMWYKRNKAPFVEMDSAFIIIDSSYNPLLTIVENSGMALRIPCVGSWLCNLMADRMRLFEDRECKKRSYRHLDLLLKT